jgi:hypothetical protein
MIRLIHKPLLSHRLSAACFKLGFAACVLFSASPVLARGDDGGVTGQSLAQALVRLSVTEGFELRGLDRIGHEAAPQIESGLSPRSLRRLLDGYAYTLELAPADVPGTNPGKPTRLTILGRTDHADDASSEVSTIDGPPETSDPSSTDPSADKAGLRSTPGGGPQLLPEMTGMNAAASASLRKLIQSSSPDCSARGQC